MAEDRAGTCIEIPLGDGADTTESGDKPSSPPWFGADDGRRAASILHRLAADAREPLQVSIASHEDAEFKPPTGVRRAAHRSRASARPRGSDREAL